MEQYESDYGSVFRIPVDIDILDASDYMDEVLRTLAPNTTMDGAI